MMGSCALGYPCTHFVPQEDPESEDIVGIIQAAVAFFASKTQRDIGAQHAGTTQLRSPCPAAATVAWGAGVGDGWVG